VQLQKRIGVQDDFRDAAAACLASSLLSTSSPAFQRPSTSGWRF